MASQFFSRPDDDVMSELQIRYLYELSAWLSMWTICMDICVDYLYRCI